MGHVLRAARAIAPSLLLALALTACGGGGSSSSSGLPTVPGTPSSAPTAAPGPLPTTPTPTPTAIPLSATTYMLSRAYPDTLGAAVLPGYTPQLDASGNGLTIDGYQPAYDISYGYHRNAVVALVANGQLLQLPRGIGMISPQTVACDAAGHPGNGNPYVVDDKQAYQLHNHDHSFIIHLEPHSAIETFKLGAFFDIWKQPLGPTQAANQSGPVRVFTYNADAATPVATEYVGNPYDAPLGTHNDDVTIVEIGAFAPLPRFTIDPNYEAFHCGAGAPIP